MTTLVLPRLKATWFVAPAAALLIGAALLAAPSRTATRYLPAVPPPFVAKSIPEATRGEPVVRRSNTSSCQFAAPLAGS